jgi:hypothetical protein
VSEHEPQPRMTISKRAFVVLIVSLCLAIGVAAGAGGLALKLQLVDLPKNRYTTNVLICRRFNAQALGIRGFVHKVSPRLDGDAKARFKVTGDCKAYARHLLHPRPPKP